MVPVEKKCFCMVVEGKNLAGLYAGTPEQEKAFVDKYKAAFEAGDKATLESFLYTKGAHPKALEFFKMMQTEGSGKKIAKIELIDLSPEEAKEAEAAEEMPDGSKTKMPLKPTKKLKITYAKEGGSGSTWATLGERRHHRGRIWLWNCCRWPVSGSTRRSLTRGRTTSTWPAPVATWRAGAWPLRRTSRWPRSSTSSAKAVM
jgi:hypothetical protein